MNAFKVLGVAAVVCLLGGTVRAEEKKIDYAKMLVGKWEIVKADEATVPVGTVVEFTKDGKFKINGKKDDVELNFEGTYTVEANKFTFKIKVGEEENSETIEITKMSENEMTTKNKNSKVVECKRKK